MNFGRLGKIGAIAVIGIVILTYGTYAMSYQGNYDVDVSFHMSVPEMGDIAITEFEYSAEPTSVLAFWELRGKSGAPASTTYTLFAEWNQSGVIDTMQVDVPVTLTYLDEINNEVDISFTFFNKAPGEASVRIYVEWTYISSIIYDKTYPVVVG